MTNSANVIQRAFRVKEQNVGSIAGFKLFQMATQNRRPLRVVEGVAALTMLKPRLRDKNVFR